MSSSTLPTGPTWCSSSHSSPRTRPMASVAIHVKVGPDHTGPTASVPKQTLTGGTGATGNLLPVRVSLAASDSGSGRRALRDRSEHRRWGVHDCGRRRRRHGDLPLPRRRPLPVPGPGGRPCRECRVVDLRLDVHAHRRQRVGLLDPLRRELVAEQQHLVPRRQGAGDDGRRPDGHPDLHRAQHRLARAQGADSRQGVRLRRRCAQRDRRSSRPRRRCRNSSCGPRTGRAAARTPSRSRSSGRAVARRSTSTPS